MMLNHSGDDLYVWIWLPDQSDPILCGALRPTSNESTPATGRTSRRYRFIYAPTYLAAQHAQSLAPDLPLEQRWFPPVEDLALPGALRDAAPDWWGRQVVLHRLTGQHGPNADIDSLDEATYLLNSSSDRFGATDFHTSPSRYQPRHEDATVDDLLGAAETIEAGLPLTPGLFTAALQGTSMGGARPKATLTDAKGTAWLAKFPTHADILPTVKAEAANLYLARACGIDVPDHTIVETLGKTVLLTKRFDRGTDGRRWQCLSGLTLLRLGEMTARYGTYPDLLAAITAHTDDPGAIGRELFTRIALNIAVSNSDDHLRNHACFWNGTQLTLTPAFDIAPTPRSGETSFQALAYGCNGERESNFAHLAACSSIYHLSRAEGRGIIEHVIDTIHRHWPDACDEARLSQAERMLLKGQLILNPGTLHGWTRRRPTMPPTLSGPVSTMPSPHATLDDSIEL